MLTPRIFLTAAICSLLLRTNCPAVLFDSTGDPNFNTTAPGGALANSGWQYEGQWGGQLGTVIAPNFFITAHHLGGSVGDTFTFQGVAYTTTAVFDDASSDLRIWQVSGTFPTYAPLYSKSDEVGSSLVVFGRGTQRGAALKSGSVLKGWFWGTADTVQRWGTNTVSNAIDLGNGSGKVLVAAFNHGAGANEAALSLGDSGGGLFIKDGTTWKLAGVNYTVDGPYSTSANGSNSFIASLFDQSGFYVQNNSNQWVAGSGPGSWYSTRISARLTWINSIISIPAPTLPATTPIQNGVPAFDRSSGIAKQLFYGISVPPGVTAMTITLSGGKGNADLYVKFGSPPTTGDSDYSSVQSGTRQTVRVPNPQEGDWFILLNTSSAYNGATLVAQYMVAAGAVAPPVIWPGEGIFAGSALVRLTCPTGGVDIRYTTDGTDPTTASTLYRAPLLITQSVTLKARAYRKDLPQSAASSSDIIVSPNATATDLDPGVQLTNLAGSGVSSALFCVTVPANQTQLIIDNYGGSGATTVFVKFGAPPTTTVFDAKLHAVDGNQRLVVPITNSEGGDYYILLQGIRSFSGASLSTQTQ